MRSSPKAARAGQIGGGANKPPSQSKKPLWTRFWRTLGPGLITGASDDDPSGIATYAQAGARFGFSITWTLLFTYPLMAAIQEISARIGRTTGRGLAGNLRRHYPNWVLQSTIALLLVANIINIGADLAAMGDATSLLVGGPRNLYVVLFAAACAGLQVFAEYSRFVAVLKWTTLSLFAYFGTVLVVEVPWAEAAHGFLIPTFRADTGFWTTVVAILGTTISPYLFFWQASQEVDEIADVPARKPLLKSPDQEQDAIARIKLDTYLGMGISNLVGLAIMVTTAATLHATGATEVESSAQVVEALRPVAGDFAFAIFALGIVGTGLLAVPVLAGSAAYAIAEARGWPVGLTKKPARAKAFYLTIVVATLAGTVVCLSPLDPIKALFWSAVINGVVAVPVMAMMMVMTSNRKVMGEFVVTGWLRVIGWIATAVMAAAAAGVVIAAMV
jgi:NRAMP (natural resistance-associated macrophage protein)-like metal ion transporter